MSNHLDGYENRLCIHSNFGRQKQKQSLTVEDSRGRGWRRRVVSLDAEHSDVSRIEQHHRQQGKRSQVKEIAS